MPSPDQVRGIRHPVLRRDWIAGRGPQWQNRGPQWHYRGPRWLFL